MLIYCCYCNDKIDARLTSGAEIYPHREDLYSLPFYKCDSCNNYVGCHKGKENKPLGVIPTPKLRASRSRVHSILDPIWKSGQVSRTQLYKELSEFLGFEYHTASLRTTEEVDKVVSFLTAIYK